MVRSDGVGDLFENGGLARARWCDDQSARAPSDGRDEINHARLKKVRRGFEIEFLDGINAREILEAHRFGVILERHVIDLVHGLELRTRAAMRRLRRPGHEAALAEEIAFDGIRRHENIRGLGMEMRGGGAQETETLLGDFQMAEAIIATRSAGGRVARRITWRVAGGIAWRVTASLIVVSSVTNVLAHNCRCIVEGGKSPD